MFIEDLKKDHTSDNYNRSYYRAKAPYPMCCMYLRHWCNSCTVIHYSPVRYNDFTFVQNAIDNIQMMYVLFNT